MTHIIRLLLLIISMFGYVFYFSRKIRAEFAIGLVMTGIISLLYISGILNLLPETAVLIFAGGFVCLFSAIKNKTPFKNVISFGIIAFVIGVIILFIVLRGNLLTHQDDFEHWALMTKLLITENRFPNFTRLNLPHKSYPPGSAVWIYFVLFITGLRAEYVQLLSQAILLLGSLISLFPFAKTAIEKFCTAGIAVILLLGNNNLRILLVDQVISLLSLSAVCFCIYYRGELKHRLFYIIPWLVSIIAVKTSGALFVFFILLMILPYIGWKRTTVAALFTGFMFLLWQKHIRLVFSNGLSSRHALSFNWWNQVLSKKSAENILDTCKLFFQREFSSGNKVYYLLLSVLLIFILCIVFKSEYSKLPKKLILFSAVFYVIYQLGLLAVYIVSMPQSEAVDLHAYSRYHQTIFIFNSGLLWITMLLCRNILPEKFRISHSFLVILCLCFLYRGIKPSSSARRRQVPRDLIRRQAFERSISGYDMDPQKKFLVLTEVRNSPKNFETSLIIYSYDPAAAVHRTLEQFIQNPNMWKSYDYLILPDESDAVKTAVRDLFHSDDTVIDLAKMKKSIN